MKTETGKELREWWNACPSKKLQMIITILLVLISFNCIYELGEAVGKFIYYIVH